MAQYNVNNIMVSSLLSSIRQYVVSPDFYKNMDLA